MAAGIAADEEPDLLVPLIVDLVAADVVGLVARESNPLFTVAAGRDPLGVAAAPAFEDVIRRQDGGYEEQDKEDSMDRLETTHRAILDHTQGCGKPGHLLDIEAYS